MVVVWRAVLPAASECFHFHLVVAAERFGENVALRLTEDSAVTLTEEMSERVSDYILVELKGKGSVRIAEATAMNVSG